MAARTPPSSGGDPPGLNPEGVDTDARHVPAPMSPSRVGDPPVPGYRLAAPTALEVLTRLADCVGGAEALRRWSEVTGRLGLHGMDLEFDDLDRVVDALAAQGGPLSVVARGWSMRIQTYRTLSARRTTGATP